MKTHISAAKQSTDDNSHGVFTRVGQLLPGVALAVALGLISAVLSPIIGRRVLGFERSPVSAVMVALLLGIIVSNTVRLPDWLAPGLVFSVKKILRAGIILLGIRLSVGEVLRLGAIGLPIVVACVGIAFLVTTLVARAVGVPRRIGTLVAVGTSICGVSAIVATGPAIGAKEEEVAYAVSVITVFGLVATLLYPALANAVFQGEAVPVGLFLGTSVHDTSQVTGSALVFSQMYNAPEALNVATVTKLVRNVFMGVVIPVAALSMRGRENDNPTTAASAKPRKFLPGFLIGFVALACVRSIGDFTQGLSGQAFWLLSSEPWSAIHGFATDAAALLLVIALAGVGLNTKFRQLHTLGAKPFIVGFAAALAVGVISAALILALGSFVQL